MAPIHRPKTAAIVALLLVLVISDTGCRDSDLTDVQGRAGEERSPFQFTVQNAKANPVELRDFGRSSLIRFTEVSRTIGVSHTYVNGEQGESIMVETLGGGCGYLDYDGDGHWDLYVNQGGDATQPADAAQPADALFRNLGDLTFCNVATSAFVAEFGYGQGVAMGDFDNDGFDDVYVTNVGANSFWKNLGDGTFQEISQAAGVGDSRWSTSAAWGDLDRDGDLDLYVCNYLRYDPMNPMDCRTKKGDKRICHPRDLDAWPDECFMNQGDGTFVAEARQRGLFGEGNKALGVAIADFNNDQWPDIYVANDTTANFCFQNREEAYFQEDGYRLGCAVDRNGSFQASMGLGVADVDHNGFLDIYATHFYGESNTLYTNLGMQGFQDITGIAGLHAMTMPYLGFGTVIHDFDQNGLPDIFVANGHIENFPDNPLRYMHPQMITFDGQVWRDDSQSSGAYFAEKYVGRGVAWCDWDEDGDADLTVMHQNSPMAMLRNDSSRGRWLKLQFRGRESNRRGIGCRVTVRTSKGSQMQELCGGMSYASTSQTALIFGLGDCETTCAVDVAWPSGRRASLHDVAVDGELILDEPRD